MDRRMVLALKNNQLLPFERNRYYAGKLLTSADFQVEQTYGSQKRRFWNQLLTGNGVLCGLGVYSLDDVSIMVESGAAVDGWGREVVLENAVMKKLSAVAGFDRLTSNRVTLLLQYEETDVHPVYAISKSGEEGYECNRIQEGYSLLLQDSEAVLPMPEPMDSFLTGGDLYEDGDFRVSVQLPANIPVGKSVQLLVRVEQMSDTNAGLTLHTTIQMPSLRNAAGEHHCEIRLENIRPGQHGCITIPYTLQGEQMPMAHSVLMVPEGETEVLVDGASRTAAGQFMAKVSLVEASAYEIIANAIGAVSLEELTLSSRPAPIPLAEFTLQRTKSAYLIEEVKERGIKRYLDTNATAERRLQYARWFAAPAAATVKVVQETAEPAAVQEERPPSYASGSCEIALTPHAKAGEVFYSDEIIHGMGSGVVDLRVGLEYYDEDEKIGSLARHTIYGDASLFELNPDTVPDATLAVRVNQSRGSFMVAARLEAPVPLVVLNVRWHAMLLPNGEEIETTRQIAGKSISAVRPTVLLGTRESHYISVNFKNMEPCTLRYELTDPDSGAITSDGVYTAPGKEGIYEIRISCADLPLITTYAYAVVKKKNAEEPSNPE